MKTWGDHLGSVRMLKRLAFSVVPRRNRPPFFQSVKVMAAILRASVRRAISGFIPLASKKPCKNRGAVPCHNWPWWPHS